LKTNKKQTGNPRHYGHDVHCTQRTEYHKHIDLKQFYIGGADLNMQKSKMQTFLYK